MKKILLLILILSVVSSCKLTKIDKKKIVHTPLIDVPAIDSTTVTTTVSDLTGLKNKTIRITSAEIFIPNDKSNTLNFAQKNTVKPKGLITYSIPDTIKWGEFGIIELRITKNKNATDFVLKNKNVVIDSIRVSNTMKVELIDIEHAFEKTDLASAIQAVEDGDEYTTWKWSIKPVKPGKHQLDIVIQIITDGVPKNIPVVTYNVFVQSQPVVEKIKSGIANGIDWTKILSVIITAGIFPLIVFLWKRRKKKKQKTDK